MTCLARLHSVKNCFGAGFAISPVAVLSMRGYTVSPPVRLADSFLARPHWN